MEPTDNNLSALADAVLAAEDGYRNIRKQDYDELKALSRPPKGLALTCQAAKILISRPNAEAGRDADGMSFGSSVTIVLVTWPSPQIQNYIKENLVGGNGLQPKIVAKLNKLRSENAEDWNLETLKKQSAAGSAVTKWIFAVLDYINAADAAGEKRTIPFKG